MIVCGETGIMVVCSHQMACGSSAQRLKMILKK